MIVHKGYRRCDSACCDLAFAKPNPMINTDLLIISCNYLSLICETEILCLPHLYLKRQFLYRISLSVCQFWKTFVAPVRHVCSSHRPPSIIIFLHVCPYGMSLLKYVRHACSSHIFVNTGKTESVQKLWRTSTNAWPLNQLSYRSCHIILTYQPQSVSQHLITEGQVTYTYSYQANTRNMHTSLPIL